MQKFCDLGGSYTVRPEKAPITIVRSAFETTATRHTEPFTWFVVESFFDDSVALSLSNEFPTDGFELAEYQSEKFYVRSLAVNGAVTLQSRTELSPMWRSVAQLISSPDYCGRVGRFLGRDLSRFRVDASLCRYEPGCCLRPHTDRTVRDTTQVVYFNREWRSDWGGMLQILRSGRSSDVVSEVLPKLNRSVIMIRSERSWHAVSPVKAGVHRERRSLVINFSKCS